MLFNVLIWFLDIENIGLDPKILILQEVMAEIGSESQFFSGNIANMIPEGPLNKMVPLTEDHLGGCMGTPVSSRTI